MKARPIPFSGALPLTIREGRKTNTRRTLKIQGTRCEPELMPDGITTGWRIDVRHQFGSTQILFCPYGAPGDLLWVREDHYRYGHWEPVAGALTPTGRQKWAFVPESSEVRFDAPPSYRRGRHHRDPWAPAWHKRLGRFMPRWASRTTLRIVEVRVERLQDISEEDAHAEGARFSGFNSEQDFLRFGVSHQDCLDARFRHAFRELWEAINGPESWDANPWVWVLTFVAINSNVDAVLARQAVVQ